MPEHREYRLAHQQDRLAGLAHFARHAGLVDLAADMERVASDGCAGDAEVMLIERFSRTLIQRQILEGTAWDAWMKTRREIRRELNQVSTELPMANIQSTGEADVLLRNVASCLTAHETAPASGSRLHATLSALSQVEALLTDHVRDQLFGHIKKQHERVDAVLVDYLSLRWVPNTSWSLTEVRNAWAHGRALIDGNSLRMHDRKTFKEIGRVTLSDLEQLVRAGQAAWTAFQFDLVFLAACDARDNGQLSMTPIDASRRERRLREALDDERFES